MIVGCAALEALMVFTFFLFKAVKQVYCALDSWLCTRYRLRVNARAWVKSGALGRKRASGLKAAELFDTY